MEIASDAVERDRADVGDIDDALHAQQPLAKMRRDQRGPGGHASPRARVIEGHADGFDAVLMIAPEQGVATTGP